MKMECPDCGKENKSKESFDHSDEYFIHHHFLCSCGRKWGANEHLERPPIPFEDTLEGRVRAEVLKMKEEGKI